MRSGAVTRSIFRPPFGVSVIIIPNEPWCFLAGTWLTAGPSYRFWIIMGGKPCPGNAAGTFRRG